MKTNEEQQPAEPDLRGFIAAIQASESKRVTASLAEWPILSSLRETTGEGWAAIHHAAACGNIEAATALLDAGCSADLPSGEFIKDGEDDRDSYFEPGVRPIAVATWKDQLAMVKLLLARGADPTGADHFSHSAVHFAAGCGRVAILNVLLANGADPNPSSERRTFREKGNARRPHPSALPVRFETHA